MAAQRVHFAGIAQAGVTRRRPRSCPLVQLVAGALALLLAGCGGDGGTAYSSPGPSAGSPPEPTWAYIQPQVFQPRCTACHAGRFASPFPLPSVCLDAYNAPDIIGRASAEQPALQLIAPGDPDASYLVRKLEGGPGISGAQMPFDGTAPLPAATIQAIRDWIAAGALDAVPSGAPQVCGGG